jgi:hypothetical protein
MRFSLLNPLFCNAIALQLTLLAGRRWNEKDAGLKTTAETVNQITRIIPPASRSKVFMKGYRLCFPIAKEATLEPKARGGYRRSRLEGHDALLHQWIEAQPDLTLEELQERLLQQLDICIGTTALWHRLKKLGLSYKKNAARRRTRPA